MHLRERSSADGILVDRLEHFVRAHAEIFGQHAGDRGEGDGRGFILHVVGVERSSEAKEHAMKDAVAILRTREEELLTIRRRALELVGKVMSHCGYESVTPYLKEVVDQMTVVGS